MVHYDHCQTLVHEGTCASLTQSWIEEQNRTERNLSISYPAACYRDIFQAAGEVCVTTKLCVCMTQDGVRDSRHAGLPQGQC